MDRISRIAQELADQAYDPAYASAREQLAQELLDWHGGGGTGLYAVGSTLLAGGHPDRHSMDRALRELQSLIDRQVNYPEANDDEDVRHLTGLRERLDRLTGAQWIP